MKTYRKTNRFKVTKKILDKLYSHDFLTATQIGNKLGCSDQNIFWYLKAYKIKTHKRGDYFKKKYLYLTKKLLSRLYLKNWVSVPKIAKQLKCDEKVIYLFLNKYNIKIRHGIRKIIYCIDCGKQLNKSAYYHKTTRCRCCLGKIRSIRFKGKAHPCWKGGNPNCKRCGKLLSDRKYLLCISCYLKTLKGKGNPNYIHGNGYAPYVENFGELRKIIRKRDNYKCQHCKTKEKFLKRKLCVHHIDYNKENNKNNNLISLCLECHLKSNFNRDYWFAYYTYVMENR